MSGGYISEVRWTGCDRIKEDGMNLSSPEGESTNENIAKRIENVLPISDRVMAVKINSRPKPTMIIIQAYASTSNSSEEELETFYAELEKVALAETVQATGSKYG